MSMSADGTGHRFAARCSVRRAAPIGARYPDINRGGVIARIRIDLLDAFGVMQRGGEVVECSAAGGNANPLMDSGHLADAERSDMADFGQAVVTVTGSGDRGNDDGAGKVGDFHQEAVDCGGPSVGDDGNEVDYLV